MTTENKTLADVQPGGRVRLGDAPERCSECRHTTFEAHPDGYICVHCKLIVAAQPSPGGQGDARRQWLEVRGLAAGIVKNLQAFADSPHKGAWCGALDDSLSFADQIEKDAAAAYESTLAASQPVGNYEVQTENGPLKCSLAVYAEWQKNEEYIERLKAELAARQPVGISAEWVLGYLTTDAPEESREAIRNAFAEYAALSGTRQPVGEPVVTAEMLAAADKYHDSDEYRSGNFSDSHTNAACYRAMAAAAPPAQAVDLGQFREAVQEAYENADSGTLTKFSLEELLALIDSKAMGK